MNFPSSWNAEQMRHGPELYLKTIHFDEKYARK
jgi:hypothetical protein